MKRMRLKTYIFNDSQVLISYSQKGKVLVLTYCKRKKETPTSDKKYWHSKQMGGGAGVSPTCDPPGSSG